MSKTHKKDKRGNIIRHYRKYMTRCACDYCRDSRRRKFIKDEKRTSQELHDWYNGKVDK